MSKEVLAVFILILFFFFLFFQSKLNKKDTEITVYESKLHETQQQYWELKEEQNRVVLQLKRCRKGVL